MINHNDTLDEALTTLESSSCPIAQAFILKFRQELGTFAEVEEQLDALEEAKEEANQAREELAGAEVEIQRLEKRETELKNRIEHCSDLLWRFRPDECARSAKDFGDEYEWNEYPDKIAEEFAPDYDGINAAFVKSVDGEVEEVWVLPKGNIYSKHALYERVF